MMSIANKESKEDLIRCLEVLYRGFGSSQLLEKYEVIVPVSEEEKEQRAVCFVEKSPPLNIFAGKPSKNNCQIIEMSDSEFEDFLDRSREKVVENLELTINNKYCMSFSAEILAANSPYFRNCLAGEVMKTPDGKQLLHIPFSVHENAVLIEIAFNFLMHGLVVVPRSMRLADWVNLYEVANYFAIQELEDLLVYAIWLKMDGSNAD